MFQALNKTLWYKIEKPHFPSRLSPYLGPPLRQSLPPSSHSGQECGLHCPGQELESHSISFLVLAQPPPPSWQAWLACVSEMTACGFPSLPRRMLSLVPGYLLTWVLSFLHPNFSIYVFKRQPDADNTHWPRVCHAYPTHSLVETPH